MDGGSKKSGLVLWSLCFSPYVINSQKTKTLFLKWEDIWRKEKVAPWIAKVPISAVGLPGEYAYIHGIGGMQGWTENHMGYMAGDPVQKLYEVVDDASIDVNPPGELSNRTKRRVAAWLKAAYPQRFRPPKPLPNSDLSWSELFGPSGNMDNFEGIKAMFVDARINQERTRFGELSPAELNAMRETAEAKFSNTYKTYRKRRRRTLSRALLTGPRLFVLAQPVPEYYLCAGRLTAFIRCVVFWNERGDQRIFLPELPFTPDGNID